MPNKNPNGKRKTLKATLLLTLLVVALTTSLFANTATANPCWWYFHQTPPPTVEGTALNTDTLTLMFSVRKGTYNGYYPYFISSIHVLVDGQLWSRHEWKPTSISVSLEGLSNGWHTVEVTATASVTESGLSNSGDSSPQASSGVIEFQVNAPPPSISVITSQKTFEPSSSTADVPLNFTVNKAVSWVGYSLDGNNIVTATDKVASTERFGTVIYQLVLRDLPTGEHTLTVYAEDTAGNRGESKLYTFTITQETPPQTKQTEPSSTTTTAAASAIIASATAIALGLAAYSLKRKRKNNKK